LTLPLESGEPSPWCEWMAHLPLPLRCLTKTHFPRTLPLKEPLGCPGAFFFPPTSESNQRHADFVCVKSSTFWTFLYQFTLYHSSFTRQDDLGGPIFALRYREDSPPLIYKLERCCLLRSLQLVPLLHHFTGFRSIRPFVFSPAPDSVLPNVRPYLWTSRLQRSAFFFLSCARAQTIAFPSGVFHSRLTPQRHQVSLLAFPP